MEEIMFELSGHRYMGKIRKNIPTEIKVNGEQVHASVHLKQRKIKEYDFTKQDVVNVSFKKKLLWYTFDTVLLAFLVFLGLSGLCIGSVELLGGALLIALISFGICARSQQMIITLKSGENVYIPVSDVESANEFLSIIQ